MYNVNIYICIRIIIHRIFWRKCFELFACQVACTLIIITSFFRLISQLLVRRAGRAHGTLHILIILRVGRRGERCGGRCFAGKKCLHGDYLDVHGS